jgi:hypothetical protein
MSTILRDVGPSACFAPPQCPGQPLNEGAQAGASAQAPHKSFACCRMVFGTAGPGGGFFGGAPNQSFSAYGAANARFRPVVPSTLCGLVLLGTALAAPGDRDTLNRNRLAGGER